MNTTSDKLLTIALTPLSWLYWGVSELRNKFFDWGMLKQERFNVPVVTVGNLSVGGTGKTPHVEFLLRQLQTSYRIGVVSRGYKRLTRGYLLANAQSTPQTIGDEPYQMYRKFGRRVKIAVCESRRKGIATLLEHNPELNLIILDDAFQHRYVNPKVSVMLMDWSRPVYDDKVLPLGQLREDPAGMNRADFVIVTKCPDNMSPLDVMLMRKRLDLMPFQRLIFTRIRYEALQPVFEEEARYSLEAGSLTEADTILLVTGIANPRPLIRECRRLRARLKVMHFPDHHNFSKKDLRRIECKYDSLKGARKVVITTEKDGGRLLHNPYFPERLKPFVFALPIVVEPVVMPKSNIPDLVAEIRAAVNK